MEIDAYRAMLNMRTRQRAELLSLEIVRTDIKRRGAFYEYQVIIGKDSKAGNISKLREAGIGWVWDIFLHHSIAIHYEMRLVAGIPQEEAA